MAQLSNLDIIREVDTFPYPEKDPKTHNALSSTFHEYIWQHGTQTLLLGYMLDNVVEALQAVPEEVRGPVIVDAEKRTVRAFEQPTEPERSAAVARLMDYWREKQTFEILKGWRNEVWPVYRSKDELLFSVERSATGLLGVMRYGVHMTAYVRDPAASHGIKIWVSQRAANKSTYPGMLDNSAAGGFVTGEDPFEAMIREADEEANIPEAVMREHCKYTGQVVYIHITDVRAGEAGWMYPESQWVYDLELPTDVVPEPKDGEVAQFSLWTVEETQAKMAQGLFKPNCALILIDFFVKHGILTKENEPHYDEIVQRMHRTVAFPGPHQAV